MAIETGKNWLFYLNTGTSVSPTWTKIGKQVDGTFEITNSSVSGTTKDHNGWESVIPTTRKWAGTFSVMYDASDSTAGLLASYSLNQTKAGFKLVGESGENWIGDAWIDAKFAFGVDATVKADVTMLTDGEVTYSAS